MRKFTKKQYLAAGAAAVIVAGGAGVAFAYWTSDGTGTGSATTGDSKNFVVTVDALTGADLTPGGPTDTVNFTVKNPGSGNQNFSLAKAKVVKTSNAGCTAADFAVTNLTAAYGDLAGGATANGSFALQMIDGPANQDACKNVTVDLQVDVS